MTRNNGAAYSELVNLRELRQYSLKMFTKVTYALDDAGIAYWLDFGTLLGAVRHGRSIYWDGDYDLSTLDASVVDNRELWERVRSYGYYVCISKRPDRINIKMADANLVGQFRVDLHVYLPRSDERVQYIVTNDTGNSGKLALRLRNVVSALMPPDASKTFSSENMAYYTTYGHICRVLLAGGIEPQLIEELGPIEFTSGRYNSNMCFELHHPDFKLRNDPLENARISTRVLAPLLRILPKSVLSQLRSFLSRFADYQSTKPSIANVVSPAYFQELSTVEFHGKPYCCPKPVEEYLSHVYGDNWRSPKSSWKRSDTLSVE